MKMALLSFMNTQGLNLTYEVYYENGVFLGTLDQGVDGFYEYWPELRPGSWSSHVLREIADKIDELDRPWQENIDEYFRQHEEGVLSEDQEVKTLDVEASGLKLNSEAS